MTSATIGTGLDGGARRRTGPADPGRGYAKGRAKREQILQAAIQLFGEVGYHSASLRELASRVDMSHPGLLHHFPTKVALLEAVLEHRDVVDRSDLGEEIEQGADYLDALVALVERNSRRRPVVELFTALAAEATSPDHPAHEYFVRRYATTVAAVQGGLQRYADSGRLRDGVDAAVAARHVVALMDGLQVQWLLEPEIDMTVPVAAFFARLYGKA